MKPVLFVICFTVGLSLMILSGYVPQSARAHDGDSNHAAADLPTATLGQPVSRTVTRRVLASESTAPVDPSAEPELTGQPSPSAEPAPAEEPSGLEISAPAPVAAEPQPAPVATVQSPPPETPNPAEPEVPAPTAAKVPVVADAGVSRTVWLGWDEIPLDGSASTGEGLTYHWRQTSGPVWLTMGDDAQAVTSAGGLLGNQRVTWRGATYEFELTVTDASGEQAARRVKHIVQCAPALTIKPTPERHFEPHDGYELAHFAAWLTNLESYESTFEITSPTELTFTKVSGSLCDLTGGKLDSVYVYQVVVYGQAGEPTSSVEYLVNTDAKVPGVIQLGVSWEER